jgi:uncharacterized DUF497 family protein
MTTSRFEWDETKSRDNLRKPGVIFTEAQTVFFDEDAVEFSTMSILRKKIVSCYLVSAASRESCWSAIA